MSIALFNLADRQGSRLIVGSSLGAASLGYRTQATALSSLSGDSGRVPGGVLFPAMAQRQHRTNRLGAVYLHGVEMLSLPALPFGRMVAVCAPKSWRSSRARSGTPPYRLSGSSLSGLSSGSAEA